MAYGRPLFSDLPGDNPPEDQRVPQSPVDAMADTDVDADTVDEDEEPPARQSVRRFGRGHAMTDEERDARRERYTRIGRLCQPPFGTCLSRAATRELTLTIIDPQTGKPLPGGEEPVKIVACANHARRWAERTDWAVVHSVTELPPQTPAQGVPRFPARIMLSLAVIDVDPETGEDLPGAAPYEVTCEGHRLRGWLDNKNVRIISRAQLPTDSGMVPPTLYTLVVENIDAPGKPYTVVAWGRKEVWSWRENESVRILSEEATPAAVSEDEPDGSDD